MKMMVGSVYGPSERNETWYELQHQFLSKTTRDYEHVVYANNTDCQFPNSNVIARSTEPQCDYKNICIGHLRGLRALVTHFRNAPRFDLLLILDSDCFPIRMNWQRILLDNMQSNQADFAAPIRFENLDTFPHPSVVFARAEVVIDDQFNFHITTTTNLIGKTVQDISAPIGNYFALVRTNVHNYHPLVSAIYYDMFYHHSAGSRTWRTRSESDYKYYDHMGLRDSTALEQQLFNKLAKDPLGYISKLRGVPSLL